MCRGGWQTTLTMFIQLVFMLECTLHWRDNLVIEQWKKYLSDCASACWSTHCWRVVSCSFLYYAYICLQSEQKIWQLLWEQCSNNHQSRWGKFKSTTDNVIDDDVTASQPAAIAVSCELELIESRSLAFFRSNQGSKRRCDLFKRLQSSSWPWRFAPMRASSFARSQWQ